MAKDTSTNSTTPITMEELLASQSKKMTSLHRGQEVEGEIISVSDKEIILDLGTKSEGVISAREIASSGLSDLKVGSKLKAFVYLPENEYGQTMLSLNKQAVVNRLEGMGGRFRGGKSLHWAKFINALNQKNKLQGKVLEVNKGGLIVEIEGIRGFLPNSQVGFELLAKASKGMEDLIGQILTVTVIEVDQNNNKLIFSERGKTSEETLKKLSSFKKDEKSTGKIVAVLPFGLVVNVGGVEGLVFVSDVSWDKNIDLTKSYTTGQEVEVKILGADLELGRLNLSIKALTEDPFAKLAEDFPVDEVVKAEVVSISEAGVVFKLKNNIEGFLPSSKVISSTNYTAGQIINMLVDSVDTQRRRINLAPFITSTEGLIYK